MGKAPKNHGKQWTQSDNVKLQRLANQNTPTGLIAHELGRTKHAVYSHASATGVSLKPVNQSPYNRRSEE